VLEPARQREVEELIELLAAFRPTKVAVEFTPDRQPRLDSLYAEYRAGRWALRRNEVYQLGFRLAAHLGHEGVHAVDSERHDFFVDLARSELEPRVQELFATDAVWRERLSRERAAEDSIAFARGETLREKLLRGNSPERLRRDHMAYAVASSSSTAATAATPAPTSCPGGTTATCAFSGTCSASRNRRRSGSCSSSAAATCPSCSWDSQWWAVTWRGLSSSVRRRWRSEAAQSSSRRATSPSAAWASGRSGSSSRARCAAARARRMRPTTSSAF
jgi:hypothetical protein